MRGAQGRYSDREDAGRVLARELTGYAHCSDVVVLALPRGGVPVAAQVARALPAPLDVLVVRKLGVPGRPELAMGAIAGAGDGVEVVWNDEVRAATGVRASEVEAVRRREEAELARRETAYRGERPRERLAGRVVVVVDDGLATGATMRAAVAAVRRQTPSRIVVAVPVASAGAVVALRAAGTDVVCPWVPQRFHAVGDAYLDFTQTSDDEVRRVLDG